MNTPPDQRALEFALGELRENYSFGIFVQRLRFEREEMVKTTLNPHFSEQLGMTNRNLGAIEAVDVVLGMIALPEPLITVDKRKQPVVSQTHADEAGPEPHP